MYPPTSLKSRILQNLWSPLVGLLALWYKLGPHKGPSQGEGNLLQEDGAFSLGTKAPSAARLWTSGLLAT